MRRSASLVFAEPSPKLRASSMFGSSQNFASPSGWLTWICLRLSSREKKKNRNSPSRKTVGDKHAPSFDSHHSLTSPSEKGKSSCCRSHTVRKSAMRIRLSASFQRSPSPGRKEPGWKTNSEWRRLWCMAVLGSLFIEVVTINFGNTQHTCVDSSLMIDH